MPRCRRRYHGMIRDCGYRLTMPRIKILEALSASKGHLSAEEIFFKVHEIYPAVGLTTIYRTLEMLVASGIVVKIDVHDGRARYELQKSPEQEPHFHLVCKKCSRIFNVQPEKEIIEQINALKDKCKNNYKFETENLQLRLYGLCKNCR